MSKFVNSVLVLKYSGSGMSGRRREDKDWLQFGRLCHVALDVVSSPRKKGV